MTTQTDVQKANALDEIDETLPSVGILMEAARLMSAKARDYNATVPQAHYYPNGLWTLLDTIHGKRLRACSVLGAMESDPNYEPNFDSLEDSFVDMINYAAFSIAFIRGELNGQDLQRCGLTSNMPVDNPVGVKPPAQIYSGGIVPLSEDTDTAKEASTGYNPYGPGRSPEGY